MAQHSTNGGGLVILPFSLCQTGSSLRADTEQGGDSYLSPKSLGALSPSQKTPPQNRVYCDDPARKRGGESPQDGVDAGPGPEASSLHPRPRLQLTPSHADSATCVPEFLWVCLTFKAASLLLVSTEPGPRAGRPCRRSGSAEKKPVSQVALWLEGRGHPASPRRDLVFPTFRVPPSPSRGPKRGHKGPAGGPKQAQLPSRVALEGKRLREAQRGSAACQGHPTSRQPRRYGHPGPPGFVVPLGTVL